MNNTSTIKELKQAVIAYKCAEECDYCPEPDRHIDMAELFCFDREETEKALEDYQGRRPDEIANTICDLVDKLEVP